MFFLLILLKGRIVVLLLFFQPKGYCEQIYYFILLFGKIIIFILFYDAPGGMTIILDSVRTSVGDIYITLHHSLSLFLNKKINDSEVRY